MNDTVLTSGEPSLASMIMPSKNNQTNNLDFAHKDGQ